jgi:hypothetical protein
MFWAKRRFTYADYGPYMDQLSKLIDTFPQHSAEFIMVSTETEDAAVSDYYVGVPVGQLLAPFDGFEPVEESELPKIIDTLHVADATKKPFKSRFRFSHEK